MRKRTLVEELKVMSEPEMLDELKALPMSSSLRTLDVNVTDDDCRLGNPGHPLSCAIALAVRRMLPKASYACPKHHGLTITMAGRYLHFSQTNKGSQMIRAFDEQKIKPPIKLTFHLFNISNVRKLTDTRKQQINVARKLRREQGRPDKIYEGDPLRLRTTMSYQAEIGAAIRRAKLRAEKAAV